MNAVISRRINPDTVIKVVRHPDDAISMAPFLCKYCFLLQMTKDVILPDAYYRFRFLRRHIDRARPNTAMASSSEDDMARSGRRSDGK